MGLVGKCSTLGPNGQQVVELLRPSPSRVLQPIWQESPTLPVVGMCPPVWPAGVVGNGRGTAHQVPPAGVSVASGSWDPHSVLNRPVSDQLAQLTVLMQSIELRNVIDNNVFSKN